MKMIDVLYDELDDMIEKQYETDDFDEDIIVRDKSIGDDAILLFGPVWHVKDKGLFAVEGTYCNYNKETGELEPDWSLTALYPDTEKEPDYNKFLYYEQSSPTTTIHNYLFSFNI